jgi:hypothetical protein
MLKATGGTVAAGDTTNEALQGELRREEKALLEYRKGAYAKALKRPEVRFVLWDVLSRIAGLFGETYVPDSDRSAYLQGRVAVGRDLMLECQRANPAGYQRMLEEANRLAQTIEDHRRTTSTKTAKAADPEET